MKAVGTLERTDFIADMFRWEIPNRYLEEVRRALEPSGLVLSAPRL